MRNCPQFTFLSYLLHPYYNYDMAKAMKSLQYVPEQKTLECEPCCVPDRVSFPSMYVDSKQIPEIDEWEVGEEYVITVKVCMKSYSIHEGSDRSNAELSVESYEREAEKSLD